MDVPAELRALFAGWEKPMILACLQGRMGSVHTDGGTPPRSALCTIGDFCFLAGRPDPALVRQARRPILVPCSRDWEPLIRAVWRDQTAPFQRYALREAPSGFDRARLSGLADSLPAGFSLSPIRPGHLPALLSQDWSRDLCGNFTGELDFVRDGLGFLALYQGVPAAGAASYAVCSTGIEIEVDTRPDMRRRGLASACAARLILECLDRGLYPGWDAHNLRSAALAQKLGYQPDGAYTAYWLSVSSGGPGDAMEQ